jgi:hypothetical protein
MRSLKASIPASSSSTVRCRSILSLQKDAAWRDVSKSSRRKCKPKHRHGCRNLNKRNQEWIGRQSGHEPAGSSVLHPHADIGNDGCEPEHGEGGAAERAPSGARQACGSIARGSRCPVAAASAVLPSVCELNAQIGAVMSAGSYNHIADAEIDGLDGERKLWGDRPVSTRPCP